MNKKLIVGLVVSLSFLFFANSSVLASSMYLTPSNGSITEGKTYAVTLKLNTTGGDPVNGFSAVLTYPADKLDVVSVTPSSTFSIEAENNFGNGNIRISRGSLSAITGNVSLATITFKGKVEGATNVNFTSGSAAPSANTSQDTLISKTGGNYSVVKPPVATPQPSVLPTPTPLMPVISEIQSKDITGSSAVISLKTNVKTTAIIEYGLEKDVYFLTTESLNLSDAHVINLKSPLLKPGVEIHYKIKVRSSSGSEASSEDEVLQLKGYQVFVRVTDDQGRPIPNINVTLYSLPKRGVTDTNGEITFKDVNPDKHLLVIKGDNYEKSQEIEVKNDNDLDKVQQYQVMIDSFSFKTPQSLIDSYKYIILAVFSFFGVIILIIFLRRRPTNNRNNQRLRNSSPEDLL